MLTALEQNQWDLLRQTAELGGSKSVTIPLALITTIEKELATNSIFDRICLNDDARKKWCEFIDRALAMATDWNRNPRAFEIKKGQIFIFIDSPTLGRQGLSFDKSDWCYKTATGAIP